MKQDSTNSLDAGTSSHEEDSQETLQSMELAIAQISMSLQESNDSVGDLINAITLIAACVQRIENRIETAEITCETAREDIQFESQQVQRAMQQAITAFQFYDRLTQRFQHIQENLRAIVDVIKAPDMQHHSLWQDLNNKVQSLYSLEQEQSMYQALINGLSEEESNKSTARGSKHNTCDIELF